MPSLEDIPSWFAEYFDISLESGQAILSLVVLLTVLLPTIIIARDRKGFLPELIVSFLTLAFLVGIGWLPFWLMIATIVLMSLVFADKMSEVVTGG